MSVSGPSLSVNVQLEPIDFSQFQLDLRPPKQQPATSPGSKPAATAASTKGAPAPKAEAAETAPPKAEPPVKVYVPQRGDTLIGIAGRFGVSQADFRKLNGDRIGPTGELRAGEPLNLPPNAKDGGPTAKAGGKPPVESPTIVAAKFGMPTWHHGQVRAAPVLAAVTPQPARPAEPTPKPTLAANPAANPVTETSPDELEVYTVATGSTTPEGGSAVQQWVTGPVGDYIQIVGDPHRVTAPTTSEIAQSEPTQSIPGKVGSKAASTSEPPSSNDLLAFNDPNPETNGPIEYSPDWYAAQKRQ